MAGKSTLVLKINDAEFHRPTTEDANDYKVFINNAETGIAPVKLTVTDSKKVKDRYDKDFIKHVNEVLTNVNTYNTQKWTETNTKNKLNAFLGIQSSDTSGVASTTEFVVSVQVALIKAVNEPPEEKNTYAADQIAVIQFPLFITTPGGSATTAYGGRRRTKISKRHSTDRTRKNKFTMKN